MNKIQKKRAVAVTRAVAVIVKQINVGLTVIDR